MEGTVLVRFQEALRQRALSGAICRIGENVLWLTGHWPRNGFCFVLVPVEGSPVLLVPDGEEEVAAQSWVQERHTFAWGRLNDGDPYVSIRRALEQIGQSLFPGGGRVGYEGSFETVAPPQMSGECFVPAGVTWAVMREALPGCQLEDVSSLIHELRTYKNEHEVQQLRRVNAVAKLGLAAFAQAVRPGVTEAEVAAAVESAIRSQGTGYNGAEYARAWAEVMSGPMNSAVAYRPYLPARNRRIESGDLVLLELATCVDGWWSDLTRTRVTGTPSAEQLKVHRLVHDAQQSAIAAVRPGARAAEVDAAARSVIAAAGYGDKFVHHTGHGLGLRYHEPAPFIHPQSQDTLAAGMVFTVEPGVYWHGFGGIRIEDNVLVTADGVEVLSEFDRSLY